MGKKTPDVIVVGMPSSGKTVFFTVLGKKFTNLLDGRRSAPLGFRMGTCDIDTSDVINVAYDRLRTGHWPEPTRTGQVMPLRWEVFTGGRRIFELSSMDVAGETFKRVFGIYDGDMERTKKNEKKNNTFGQKDNSDLGNELYRPDVTEGSITSTITTNITNEEDAAEILKDAIKNAKVVCFMINIALPEGANRRKSSDDDNMRFLRFRNSVVNMYLSLKEDSDLRAKSMIVLTQSYRYQGAIERAGGPIMFLGDMCGGEASELSNLAKEHNIPVLAVSAINEATKNENLLPEIETPEAISSLGLFGFLLTVSGMAAKDDALVAIKDAYMTYQRERVEYLKCPSQTVKLRLMQAIRCNKAASDFVSACNKYLEDPSNLTSKETDIPLKASVLENYRRFTKADPEVRIAEDREYILRDQFWDKALRSAVIDARDRDKALSIDDIYQEVKERLCATFLEKSGNENNEEFVYGFSEDELFAGSEASNFREWIKLNINEYSVDLDSSMTELYGLSSKVVSSCDTLSRTIGEIEFYDRWKTLEIEYESCVEKISQFRLDWLECGAIEMKEVLYIQELVERKYRDAKEFLKKHTQVMEELNAREAEMRRKKISMERAIQVRRQICVATVFVLSALFVALISILSIRNYHHSLNKEVAKKIKEAILASDYVHAKHLYGSLVSIKWLKIDRNDYFEENFSAKLNLAVKCSDACKRIKDIRDNMKESLSWLAKVDESVSEAVELKKQSKIVLDSCDKLSLASSNDSEGNIEKKIHEAEKCESSLSGLNKGIEKLKNIVDRKMHKERLFSEMHAIDVLVQEIESCLGDIDCELFAIRKERVKGLVDRLHKLASEDDKVRIKEFEEKTEEALQRLEDRQKQVALEKLIGNVKLSMDSGGIEQAWELFDEAANLSLKIPKSTQVMSELKSNIEDVTLKSYVFTLSNILNDVEGISIKEEFTAEMIEDVRKSVFQIEKIYAGIKKRISETHKGIDNVNSVVKDIRFKMPIIVQIDGVDADSSQAIDIVRCDSALKSIVGISPETEKKCVYLHIDPTRHPAGSSCLVKVIDSYDKVHGMAIYLPSLSSGINRRIIDVL